MGKLSGEVLGGWRTMLRDRVLPVFGRRARSLPSRIIVSVFAAALVTSLVVSWSSTRSIGGFLREKIDQKFPSVLRSTTERLDLWYAQRLLDVQTFARSATVVSNLRHLGESARASRRKAAHTEVHKYLGFVLEGSPQYAALLVFAPNGDPLLSVGEEFDLPQRLRGDLAAVDRPRVGDIRRLGGRPIQVVSTPITNYRDQRVGSLHALMAIEVVEAVLHSDDLGESAAVSVVGPDGRYLMHSRGGRHGQNYDRPLPEAGAAPVLADHENAAGERVVASAMRFPRFGWVLVVEEPYDEAFAPVVSVIRKNLVINLAIVLVFGVLAFQIARSIVRPIQALSEGARRIAQGQTGVTISDSKTGDEIGVLIRVFNEMSSQLEQNQAELERNRVEIEQANHRLVGQNEKLRQVNEILEQLSITDGLTKLHNHRFFHEHLRREIKRSRRTSAPLSLILIDIDNFKNLNDRYGHATGDIVLEKVADVMSGLVRETDLLARYGGEEFALVASQTNLEGAVALAEKIRLEIAETRCAIKTDSRRKNPPRITVSVGVAALRGDAKAFFNDADRALYRAKSQGKDCVVAAAES